MGVGTLMLKREGFKDGMGGTSRNENETKHQ